MRRFNITVNGQNYDVTVDEAGGVSASAPVVAAPAAAPVAAPVQAPAAPAAASAAPVSVPEGKVKVTAPMPGNVIDVVVNVGDVVQAGDKLVVLESMKMENDIVAPEGGTVVSIAVSKGDMVSTGALFVVLG